MIKLTKHKDNLDNTAAKFSGRAKCTDCPIYQKGDGKVLCNEDLILVCDYAFRKGFKSGYKHHRKISKNK